MRRKREAHRDLVMERFVDSLIRSRGYLDGQGRLDAQRLVADAGLIARLVYPNGQPGALAITTDNPQKRLRRRVGAEDEDH
jgi:hypothetical protein